MTTIPYDRPVKDLIAQLSATGHVTHDSYTKTSVTIHHNDGVKVSHEGVLNTWKTRPASAHFDVDFTGAVAQYVKVDEYAWGVGKTEGNKSTISIEMADATGKPTYEISTDTLNGMARLAAWLYVHVIKAPPTENNFFMHKHWVATDCPGPYVSAHFSPILQAVQAQYRAMTNPAPVNANKTISELASEVILGLWGNGQDRINRLKAKGYDPVAVQAEVNRRLHPNGIDAVAREVIAGKYGNDPQRSQLLAKEGYDPKAVQARVNQILS